MVVSEMAGIGQRESPDLAAGLICNLADITHFWYTVVAVEIFGRMDESAGRSVPFHF